MLYKFKEHQIELYSSIEKMPILRFQKFNKYIMKSSDVGNEHKDFTNKISKITQYILKGMESSALQELENLNMIVFNSMNEISPKSKAFAVLVKRIDDKEYLDYSSESLDDCLIHLDKIGVNTIEALEKMQEVKKK